MSDEKQQTAAVAPDVPPPPCRKRRRWPALLLWLLVFVLGAVCGGGLTLVLVVKGVRQHLQHPERRPQKITRHLTRRLDLDAAQEKQVGAVIEKHHAALMRLRAEAAPRVAAELRAIDAEITHVLTPEQQKRWRAMVDNWRTNWLPQGFREEPAASEEEPQ